MAKLEDIQVKLKFATDEVLAAYLETQSALLADRDKYKTLYEASQDAFTEVLGQLTTTVEELSSLKGEACG